ELNPIEQFWAQLKNYVRRERLMDEETLQDRIHEAAINVTHQQLRAYISHSVSRLQDCLN
ncbi:hypothetical protein DM01DRAFT_1269696, partial [Hesseltinella vesiculosa]